MTLNFTMFAQNSDVDYVLQACLCAMSIKQTNPNSSICLITDDVIPKKYVHLFDYVEPIPWGDLVKEEKWKVINRWKTYHVTPFKKTFVLDTDMLVLSDLSHWTTFLDKRKLFFTTTVKDYRGNIIDSNYYRKAFTENNLPNLYSGLHYFEKSELSHTFYKVLEMVMKNWKDVYAQFPSITKYQRGLSVDLSAAITAKILDCEEEITATNDTITFTHMKYHCQDWKVKMGERWQDRVGVYLTDSLDLKIGSYAQHGIFHYTEDDFLTEQILSAYEKKLGI